MPTVYFIGKATAVAQVTTVQVTAYDAATTYILTVGGTQIVSVTGDTDVNTTATAIETAWNNSTHPYASGVTASATTDTVSLTSDTAGVPFVVTTSKSGGTGTIGAATTTTASAGPNDWSTAANWSGGAIPVNNDDVVVDVSVPILWGLNQSAVTLDSLRFGRNFETLGLPRDAFTTSATTQNDAYDEYRDTYLQIQVAANDGPVTIGENLGGGSAGSGAARIKLNLGSTAANVNVIYTQSASTETDLPVVRLLADSATTDIAVSGGLVGIAVDAPGEASTVQNVTVADVATDTTKVVLGAGVTATSFKAGGGTNVVLCALTTLEARDGITTTEGKEAIGTATAKDAGTVVLNSTGIVTNAEARSGGTIDEQQSGQSRQVTNPKVWAGGIYKYNAAITHSNPLAPQENVTLTAA